MIWTHFLHRMHFEISTIEFLISFIPIFTIDNQNYVANFPLYPDECYLEAYIHQNHRIRNKKIRRNASQHNNCVVYCVICSLNNDFHVQNLNNRSLTSMLFEMTKICEMKLLFTYTYRNRFKVLNGIASTTSSTNFLIQL